MPESGDWIGFYTYGDGGAHHTMEMNLAFSGSVLIGRGMDDIGMFSISGSHAGSGCAWTKSYESHCIEYQGVLEDGRIWGTWSAGSNCGGLMIWPRKNPNVAVESEFNELVVAGERAASREVHNAKPR
jgi:hypothetical protein